MDMEKVIKGLECHQIDNNHRINCTDCPYYVDDDNHIQCVNDLHDDAIALLKEDCHNCKLECLLQRYDKLKEKYDSLLKEQEAVEPIPPEDEFDLYRCGKCYHQLFRCVDKYCSRCGQAVKWDD